MTARTSATHSAQTPEVRTQPDFIICGAPKCGTTTLHFILDQHPDIALPDDEVHFFDADDPITHNDFFRTKNGELVWYDPDRRLDQDSGSDERRYYASRFSSLGPAQIIGEDSTTYIFSAIAAQRIARHMPDVKLIFMLRDPVKRAYSQYWHQMNSARTTLTFEQAIARTANIILGSTYTPNLKPYFDLFPREQIKVILFEDFVADQQAYIDDVTDFLGADPFTVDPDKAWFNKTLYTKSFGVQRLFNQIGGGLVGGRQNTLMKTKTDYSVTERLRNKLHRIYFDNIYPGILTAERPPAMRQSTRTFLTKHLTLRNQGLSDLLDCDVERVWNLKV